MRNLTVCLLTLALMEQAVVSLECYYCLNGGNCFTTQQCMDGQDQCITIFFPFQGTFAQRCSSTYDCEVINALGGSAVQAICCGTDLCNQ